MCDCFAVQFHAVLYYSVFSRVLPCSSVFFRVISCSSVLSRVVPCYPVSFRVIPYGVMAPRVFLTCFPINNSRLIWIVCPALKVKMVSPVCLHVHVCFLLFCRTHELYDILSESYFVFENHAV